MIPLWYHIPVVVALVASHAVTAWLALRRIRALEGALAMRRVLMGEDGASAEWGRTG